MSRYIDIEDVANAIYHHFPSVRTMADARSVIEEAPTIDAVSVVHGEWMPNPKIGWGETWVCSICGEKTTSSIVGKPRYNYCPMCGAKMKGADND